MRAQAEKDSALDEQRIKATVEEEKKKILASAEQEIASATAQAHRQLQQYAADLAIEQAARKLSRLRRDRPSSCAGLCPPPHRRRLEGRAKLMSVVSLRYAHAFAAVVASHKHRCSRGPAAAERLQRVRSPAATRTSRSPDESFDPVRAEAQGSRRHRRALGMFPQVRNFIAVIMDHQRLHELNEILAEYRDDRRRAVRPRRGGDHQRSAPSTTRTAPNWKPRSPSWPEAEFAPPTVEDAIASGRSGCPHRIHGLRRLHPSPVTAA